MDAQTTGRMATRRIKADYAKGRRANRSCYGKISGRAKVGFTETDWKFILWLAKDMGITISEAIRDCVAGSRKHIEEDVFEDGDRLPWLTHDESAE